MPSHYPPDFDDDLSPPPDSVDFATYARLPGVLDLAKMVDPKHDLVVKDGDLDFEPSRGELVRNTTMRRRRVLTYLHHTLREVYRHARRILRRRSR